MEVRLEARQIKLQSPTMTSSGVDNFGNVCKQRFMDTGLPLGAYSSGNSGMVSMGSYLHGKERLSPKDGSFTLILATPGIGHPTGELAGVFCYAEA